MACFEFLTPKLICEAIRPVVTPYLAKFKMENQTTLYDAMFIGSPFNGYKIAQSGLEVIIPVNPQIKKSVLTNDSVCQEQCWSVHVVERSLTFADSFDVRANLATVVRPLADIFYNCEVISKPQSFNHPEQFELKIHWKEVRDRIQLPSTP